MWTTLNPTVVPLGAGWTARGGGKRKKYGLAEDARAVPFSCSGCLPCSAEACRIACTSKQLLAEKEMLWRGTFALLPAHYSQKVARGAASWYLGWEGGEQTATLHVLVNPSPCKSKRFCSWHCKITKPGGFCRWHHSLAGCKAAWYLQMLAILLPDFSISPCSTWLRVARWRSKSCTSSTNKPHKEGCRQEACGEFILQISWGLARYGKLPREDDK